MLNKYHIHAIFPNWYNESWVSYTLKSILENIGSNEVSFGASVLAIDSSIKKNHIYPKYGKILYKFAKIFVKDTRELVEIDSLKYLSKGDVAYFWLGSSQNILDRMRAQGILIAREMINCSLEMRRSELNKAYSLLGLVYTDITDEAIAREKAEILASNYIYCPNKMVKKSVVDYGFPADRCIESSYGVDDFRICGYRKIKPRDTELNVAFVGTVDLRKGAPLVIQAWIKAGIQGKLFFAGNISAEMQTWYSQQEKKDNISFLGHISDTESVYKSADVFIFPSWEEGGPLVTIEAMAAGCVPLVTEMGSGGYFLQTDRCGVIVSPGDVDALARELVAFDSDRERLHEMSSKAIDRSKYYTWKKVGSRRLRALTALRASSKELM